MGNKHNLVGGTGSTPSKVAVECDPPEGTASAPTGKGAGGTAPSRLDRKYPAHFPVREIPNRSNIIFVTVCSKDRKPIFATSEMHKLLLAAWENADLWRVGRYVIMPDHIHFFCAPATCEYPSLKEWVKYWKSLVARAVKGKGPLAHAVAVKRDSPGGTASTPSGLWQRDFWDTQLRRGESYSTKWEYVRNNPVRAGLVDGPEDWPFAGEVNVLRWSE